MEFKNVLDKNNAKILANSIKSCKKLNNLMLEDCCSNEETIKFIKRIGVKTILT